MTGKDHLKAENGLVKVQREGAEHCLNQLFIYFFELFFSLQHLYPVIRFWFL